MNRFFCSSVPNAMIVGPISPSPSEFAIGGASTRAISSQKSDCSIRVALRPPYSFGHETAAQPPSYSFRCQARRYRKQFLEWLLPPLAPILRNVRFKPRTQLIAELLFFSCEIQIHSMIPFESAAAVSVAADRATRRPQVFFRYFVIFGISVLACGRSDARPCQYFFRSSFFRIFPVPVFGNDSKNSTDRGAL